MFHFPTRFSVFLVFGGMALLAATLAGQETVKSRFKVVAFAELSKGADEKKGEPAAAALLESLNRLGKTGWEAMAEGERGVVFRESPRGHTWEYRLVRAPESTLNGKSDDDEVLQLVLDGLSAQGWELCMARALDGKHLVFKRGHQRYYEKESKKADVGVPLPLPALVPLDFPSPPRLPSPPSDSKK